MQVCSVCEASLSLYTYDPGTFLYVFYFLFLYVFYTLTRGLKFFKYKENAYAEFSAKYKEDF